MLTKVAIDVLLAIKEFEKRGISHGEITKNNTMIQNLNNQNFLVKLINLNVYKDVDAAKFQIRGDNLYYMPPEFWSQLQNASITYDTALELW